MKNQATHCSWKKLIFRVLFAVTRFLVRCIFVVVLIGVLRASFTFERNFFERDSLYYDVDLVACVVDGDSTACKRLH